MRRKGVEYLGKKKETKRTREEKKWREEEIKELFKKNIEENAEEIQKGLLPQLLLETNRNPQSCWDLEWNDLKRKTNK